MNPFVGLRPYREDERHLFMGRELAAAYVETKSAINPLTLLFARSGIGKSSFLTSRLIPELREEHSIAYLNEWGGRKPEDILRGGLEQLGEAARARGGYLLLDQFEDVFKLESDRSGLWDCLAETVNTEDSGTRVIVTIREEWLGAWEEVEQYVPQAYSSMIRLAPLTEKELRRAIIRPVEIEGRVRLDESFVDVLLRDLRQPNAFGLGARFVEPGLLQLVCYRLWEEAERTSRVLDGNLYYELGGADAIVRDFVWRHLRSDSSSTAVFATDQRVLWAGLARHLSVAQGVKATVTPEMLSQKLLLTDLGISGPAVAAGKGLAVRNHLLKPVERRSERNEALTAWIAETLDKAHSVGFLKRQQGFKIGNDRARLYELSHDGLDAVFKSFSLEFEKRMVWRIAILWIVIVVFLFVLPGFVFLAIRDGFLSALAAFAVGVVVMAVYGGLLWLMMKLLDFLAVIIYYPIVRRLARGSIKSRQKPAKKPPPFPRSTEPPASVDRA
jgi:hypothetical protein